MTFHIDPTNTKMTSFMKIELYDNTALTLMSDGTLKVDATGKHLAPKVQDNIPDVAIKVSIWYWKNRVRPRINNFNNTKAVTKSVNGGLNGLAAREKYTQHFKAADPVAAKAGKK